MDVEFACSAQFPKEPAAPLVPHFPRFRALALFGRRPLQRGEGLVIAGGRKPTHKQTSPLSRRSAPSRFVMQAIDACWWRGGRIADEVAGIAERVGKEWRLHHAP